MPGRASKPQIFVPSLYFIEGLPYTIVNQMSVVMLKNFGAGNDMITLVTANLSLPWMFKLVWAPLVDFFGTRRGWILTLHVVLAVLTALLAASMLTSHAIEVSIAVFAVIAFASATQDIAIDGYYMDVLDKERQALYVGVRNVAYKVAWLTGSGALVWLAGFIGHDDPAQMKMGWLTSYAICSGLLALAWLFHRFVLPHPPESHVSREAQPSDLTHLSTKVLQFGSQFKDVFISYVTQRRALWIIAYILLFRAGDALMLKIAPLFLLDPRNKGGLGITTEQVGIIYSSVGTIFLLIGGIVGSWLVCKFGLKRTLMPAAIFQSLAIPLYWALAVYQPDATMVACVNAFEQFSYGVGVSAYTAYLLSTVKPEFKASHYAIATGIMAMGLYVPNSISGTLQSMVGYQTFFLISFAASFPGILTIPFLPYKETTPEPVGEVAGN